MAKYQQYEEYKDSGVEWLGEIPRDWKITRIKHSATLNMGQSPNSEDCNMDGNGYPFLQGNAEFGTMSPTAKQYCPIPRKLANEGDLLFSVRAPVGALNVADKVYGIGRGLCSLTSNSQMTQSFLWWVLPSYKYQLDAISTGSTFEAVSAEQVSNLLFALPTYGEQAQNANFLNHETAQIDTLIDKQQTLIQLLKEKRQAVISHAVTKGLNPDAPMKDSGVEWLGEVPEHWSFATIRRYLLEHRQGYYTSDPYVDDGTKLLRITDLRELGEIDIKECPMVSRSQSLKNYLLKEGDVVFARTGGAGSFGVVPKLKEDIAYASYLIRFRFLPRFFTTEYLRFMLIADSFQLAVKSNIHGGVTQNIHAEDIKNTFVASPPLEEQNKISAYLITQTNSYADLIKKAEQAIQLMQERRTALISAAVTGKIDVRGWQAPE